MSTNLVNCNELAAKFFQPIVAAMAGLVTRCCPSMSDIDWAINGVYRVIHQNQSGRDFVQHIQQSRGQAIGLSNFFEMLKSDRRGKMIRDLNELVLQQLKDHTQGDFLGLSDSLSEFDVYAADGHSVEASAHCAFKAGKKRAVQYIYAQDLRTQGVRLLAIPDPLAKKEHEVKTLKRLDVQQLRMGAAKGRKVVMVYDRAGIDIRWWHRCKKDGLYFVSRKKENMNGDLAENPAWDRGLDINKGVKRDGELFTSQGVCLRCVEYVDPVTAENYAFITTLPYSVPPGLVALLYRLRWNLEETFKEFKCAMGEDKAWGKSIQAKAAQASFICLAHNLNLIMEIWLKEQHKIVNHSELKRKTKRQLKHIEIWPRLTDIWLRMTQRSVKFIRWLNNNLWQDQPLTVMLQHLRYIYARL